MADPNQQTYPEFSGIEWPVSNEGYKDILDDELSFALRGLRSFAAQQDICPGTSQQTRALADAVGSCLATVITAVDMRDKETSVPLIDGQNFPAPRLSWERQMDPFGNKRRLEASLQQGDSLPATVNLSMSAVLVKGSKRQECVVKLPAGNRKLTATNCVAVDYVDHGIVMRPSDKPEAPKVQEAYISLLQSCVSEILLHFPEPLPTSPTL